MFRFSNNEPMTAHSRNIFIFLVTLIAFLSILFSLSKGSTSISIDQLLFVNNDHFELIFWKLRLPRTLTAFTCGGLLALAGVLIQLLLLNPLADPYALGISGGAAFFTLMLMLIGISPAWLPLGAWVGSLSTIVLILALAHKHRFQSHQLLLTGIALACGFSAGVSCLLLLSSNANLHSMLFWLSGDLNNVNFPFLGISILAGGVIISIYLAPGLNLLGRGFKEAQVLGLACTRYRVLLYLLSSLFTAQAVTMAGCIGFVGLIIPHLTRLLSGYDHRYVIPLSVLLGGSLLTVADTCARTLFAPQQLPVGMIMAMIGVPIFIGLLQK